MKCIKYVLNENISNKTNTLENISKKTVFNMFQFHCNLLYTTYIKTLNSNHF